MMERPNSLDSVADTVQPLEPSSTDHFDNKQPSKEVLELWRNADVVCFDVDSTVCIDELAEFCGVGKAVAGWTYRFSAGIEELVNKLKARNTDVYLISGGLRQMINARKPGVADMFICYAGVQLRESVAAKVDWLVFSFI